MQVSKHQQCGKLCACVYTLIVYTNKAKKNDDRKDTQRSNNIKHKLDKWHTMCVCTLIYSLGRNAKKGGRTFGTYRFRNECSSDEFAYMHFIGVSLSSSECVRVKHPRIEINKQRSNRQSPNGILLSQKQQLEEEKNKTKQNRDKSNCFPAWHSHIVDIGCIIE